MTPRLFTILTLLLAAPCVPQVALASLTHSPANDRACIEQLNALSERLYTQQLNLTQLKAQIGDDEINNSNIGESVAKGRADSVDAQINQRERAQRSISVVAQLVYGQRAGVTAMNYTKALKYAQHNFALLLQEPTAPQLSLPEIERVGKQLRQSYGSCSTHLPNFGAFADLALKNRGVAER